MTVGKEPGEFTLQPTAVTAEPGKVGSMTLQVSIEGSAPGEFTVDAPATMTIDRRNGKDGDYRISARCCMRDGKTVHGDEHTWSVAGITEVSGWRAYAVRGDSGLQARSFNSTMYERP